MLELELEKLSAQLLILETAVDELLHQTMYWYPGVLYRYLCSCLLGLALSFQYEWLPGWYCIELEKDNIKNLFLLRSGVRLFVQSRPKLRGALAFGGHDW